MDGLESIMSNVRKVSLFFCLSCENQFITSLVFFHWLNLHFDLISVLILSKIYLLTLPISSRRIEREPLQPWLFSKKMFLYPLKRNIH